MGHALGTVDSSAMPVSVLLQFCVHFQLFRSLETLVLFHFFIRALFLIEESYVLRLILRKGLLEFMLSVVCLT